MNINRPLMPGFLKRAEQKLLLNKPLIWSTRVHLVLYYGILYNLFLAGLSFLAPMNILGRSQTSYWVGFQVIIGIIALTVWLIYLLRFNVFKKYGNIKPMHALVSFLLYFISTGIIVLSVFIYPMVECVRANMAFDAKELVQDINNMNIKICQVEHKQIHVKWDYDTLIADKYLKVDSLPAKTEEEDYDTIATEPITYPLHGCYKVTPVDFKDRVANADSVVRLNDTTYIVYKIPDLVFVYCYTLEEPAHQKLLSSLEIYNRALKHPPTPAEVRTIAKELNALERKYVSISNPNTSIFEGENVADNEDFETIQQRHEVGNINTGISNIVSKKYDFSGRYLTDMIRAFYYFTLGISLLIFIFRYTTVRTFFLSLLSGTLLTILTVMVLSFFSYNGAESFISWIIAYTLIFFVGSVFTFSSSRRSVLNGIFINLFVFLVPILPLLVVDFFYEMDKEVHYKEFGTYDWPFMDQCFLYAEIGGAVLFLALLVTYINRVYRRWYSLPEN